MNQRLLHMRARVRAKEQHSLRTTPAPDLISECQKENLTWTQRSARLTRRMCEAEIPVILPDERILFTRTIVEIPPLFSPTEYEQITHGYTLHELGPISNICADWGRVLEDGLMARREKALATRQRWSAEPFKVEFIDCAIETIDAVLALAQRYSQAAYAAGRPDLGAILAHVPAQPPRTFHEALQALRLLHAVVWMSGNYHVGLGRFDQYMYPYLAADLESKRLDLSGAEALLAEFIISLNKDSHLYPGVQQGDNGQTLTLGGMTPSGEDGVNLLTRMALRVAKEVSLIDPKINLRVSSNTHLDLLELATELTRKGLGFPQYSNDDVVIPALAAHGYALEDARNYTVAACWEFIIPGKGMEIVNIGAVSFPHAVNEAIRKSLAAGADFNSIKQQVKRNIQDQVDQLVERYETLFLPPAVYYSVLMDGCIEEGCDLSAGLRYNNFGIHGAASANAADALAAVKHIVFDERSLDPWQLLEALDTNYDGAEDLRLKLQQQAPKVGTRHALADDMLVFLFDTFAEACERHQGNRRAVRIRPGTGSAMYYIWLAEGHQSMPEPVVGATADGRHQGDYFSANLAPSPGLRNDSPIAVFESFCQIDYQRIYNGGPVTVELSDSVFRNQEGLNKVAMLVRMFLRLGGQQLQINSLNADMLKDARQHPEKHSNLIVRVWGWSGYFCELSPQYQDHIINRCLYISAW
jgi:pyruvate-formate lyase